LFNARFFSRAYNVTGGVYLNARRQSAGTVLRLRLRYLIFIYDRVFIFFVVNCLFPLPNVVVAVSRKFPSCGGVSDTLYLTGWSPLAVTCFFLINLKSVFCSQTRPIVHTLKFFKKSIQRSSGYARYI
jgi:hypothetical protein